MLRDVPEESQRAKKVAPHLETSLQVEDEEIGGTSLSAEDIEAAVTGKHQSPKQAEVNASIDALRPDNSVLDKRAFENLTKTLLNSYNARQLARYLVQSLSGTALAVGQDGHKKPGSGAHIITSLWRPGRTPLERRIGRISLKKGNLGTTKSKLTDHLMRQAWHITIHSEEQQLGELEMQLESWQMKMMFDLRWQDKPALATLVDSPFLLRASEIRPFRPDNVVRIAARKRDGEEIARQLQNYLAQVSRLDMDLTVFKPLLRDSSSRPDRLEDLFKKDHIDNVSDRTGSVIELDQGGKLAIYSIQDGERYGPHARRLLLSLLDLPSPKSTIALVPSEQGGKGDKSRRSLKTYSCSEDSLVLNEVIAPDAHRRYAGVELARLTAPIAKQAHNATDGPSKRASRVASRTASTQAPESAVMGGRDGGRRLDRLVGVLDKMSLSEKSHDSEGSVWGTPRSRDAYGWRAEFCMLVRPQVHEKPQRGRLLSKHKRMSPSTPGTKDHNTSFTTLHRTPGLSQLLSYFKPDKTLPDTESTAETEPEPQTSSVPEHEKPYLVAHFLPSPFSKRGVDALKALPRITLSLRTHTEAQKLRVAAVKATLQRRDLQVPFPEQAVDLSFTRWSTLDMQFRSGTKMILSKQTQLGQLRDFTRRLETSIFAGSGALLDTMPELEIKLPWWVAAPKTTKAEDKVDVGVQYLLDRLEQHQVMNFVPANDAEIDDPEVRRLLEQWPESMRLRVREVDAGAYGGRRTEVSLVNKWGAAGAADSAGGEGKDAGAVAGGPARMGGKDRLMMQEQTAVNPTRALATTAARLLSLLTRANAGQLQGR